MKVQDLELATGLVTTTKKSNDNRSDTTTYNTVLEVKTPLTSSLKLQEQIETANDSMHTLLDIPIQNSAGKLVVSSRIVANVFGKEHRHVLEALDTMLEGCAEMSADLIQSNYINEQNKQEYREYLLTKKGLNLYLFNIQGYNNYKLAFLNKFEEMEQHLADKFKVPTSLKEALKLALAQQEQLESLQIANDEQQAIIEQQKPKVLFANSVASSKNSMLIGELAKIITQNGYPIGQNRLFTWLRDNGYLAKYGERKNLPNQQYIEQGLFEIKKTTIDNPDGTIRTTSTTKVTGKGAIYFVNKFLNNQNNNYLKVGNDN